MAPFLGSLIEAQRKSPQTYIEPFAGGAGAALRLLSDEYVQRIVLNDLDHRIAAFWRAVFCQTTQLIRRVRASSATVAEWHLQRAIYLDGNGDDLDLGFATFFLNRTNRSGILSARPIGGLKQAGEWRIGARYNKEDLIARIELLGRYRRRVTIRQEDGVAVSEEYLAGGRENFLYIDPPYLEKASDLYLDTLTWEDHLRLSRVLRKRGGIWVLTYDHDTRVPGVLYKGFRCVGFEFAHTAAIQHVGREYAVFSQAMNIVGG